MATNKKNRLHNICVSEISLVDKGAVAISGLGPGRNFLIFKRDNDGIPETMMYKGYDLMKYQPNDPGWKAARSEAQRQLESVLSQLEKSEDTDEHDAIEMICKIERGLLQLKESDPALYAELEKDPSNFDFEEQEDSFLITKKVHNVRHFPSGPTMGPNGWPLGETATHKFSLEDGKWYAKRSRDNYGRFR